MKRNINWDDYEDNLIGLISDSELKTIIIRIFKNNNIIVKRRDIIIYQKSFFGDWVIFRFKSNLYELIDQTKINKMNS